MVKLSDLCRISGRVGWRGYTVNDLRATGPLVLGANDINSNHQLDLKEVKHISKEKYEESPEIKIEKYDILIVKVGSTIGKVAIVDDDIGEACINPTAVLLKDCKINPFYIYYTLISPYGQSFLLNNSVASAQPAINQKTLKSMPVQLPVDDALIDSISNTLNRINIKIKINNKINQELEAMAKTIYDYWFVQFEFPNEEGKPYKSSGGKMVFNEELKREIPEGWEVKTLADIAHITMGQSPEGASYNDEGCGEIFFQGSTDFGWRFPAVRQFTTQPKRMAQKGDVLLSVRAPVGALNIADNKCCIGRGLASLRSKTGYNSYLYFALQYQNQIFANWNNTGTTFGSITKEDLFSLKLIFPKRLLLERYNQLSSKNDELISCNYKQIQQLTELRDWLLPMLMNGQVRVQ